MCIRDREKLVERQSSLLKDLLDVTRLDADSSVRWEEPVNLSQVISDAVDEIRAQAEKRQVNLNNLAAADGVVVAGNSIQLQRALVNLLANAVSYTAGDGNVTVSTQVVDGSQVKVVIKDDGVGIDPDDLPHIFDRFYRGDKARTRAGGGTGLGLAITHEIIKRHRGAVEVDSQVGAGTQFTVILPVLSSSESIKDG